MDPLGTILEAFSSYFTPPFLAAALIIGYIMFFLFFYGTDYWNSIDWSERFFFGFIIGMFSMIVCTFVSIPLTFLLFALHLGNWAIQIVYLVPGIFLMFLISLRVDRGAPLSSKRINSDFRAFLQNRRFYWPWFLILVSFVAFLWLGWNNPFFDVASRSLWLGFIFALNMTVFLTFGLLTWFVILFSSIPNKVSWFMVVIVFPAEILELCFLSFFRNKKRLWERATDEYWV